MFATNCQKNVDEPSIYYIYYCAEIYGNVPLSRLKPLQLIQNRALRALQYKNKYFPINHMHRDYEILKIQDMVQYKQSKIIHSLLTGATRLPPVLNKLIVPGKSTYKYATRKQNSVYKVKPRRPIGQRLIKCKASKYWNDLPIDITLQQSHVNLKLHSMT